MSLSSRLWKFRRYRLWIWLAFIFTIPIGIVAGLLNLAALIATDNDFIRNIEEIENEKDNSR
jgi:hypothetical protein